MSRQLRARLVAAVAALLAATTFLPLVQGVAWMVELVVTVIVSAGIAALAHRYLGPAWASAAGLLSVALVLSWLYAGREAVLWVLPGPATVERLVQLVQQGVELTNASAAPAPGSAGMRLVVVGGLALVWWAVDVIAVAARRPAVAGLPLLAVYCVPVALIPGGLSWWWFVTAAAGYLALLASDAGERVARWGRVVASGPGGPESRATMSATGRRVGALAVTAGVLLPALVPGLTEGLLPAGSGSGDGPGDGTISVLNPILSLRDDLTANADVTVLEYETTDLTPDPLRVVTVDSFDGSTWEPTYGTLNRDQRVAGEIVPPPGLSPQQPVTPARTTVTIDSLRQGWLPTPYPPQRVDVSGNWLYDATTLNIIGDDEATRQGMQYTVQHLLVEPSPQVLADAGPAPADVVTTWTALPETTPDSIRQQAVEVAGVGTQLEQATRLQSWFRSGGGFRYSLDAPEENGSSAVADFLDRRSGYCVHFASAMALMARSLDIPARVAVGFLPGERISPGRYQVSRQDAHAWPELYFEGVGWMRFEPTPATRSGTLPGWAAPEVDSEPASPATTAPAASSAAPVPTAAREPGSADQGLMFSDVTDWLRAVPWRVVAALSLVLALLVAPAVTAMLVRRRRWAAANDPPTRAEAAWQTLIEQLGDLGMRLPASLTLRQASQLIGEGLPSEALTSLHRVAAAVEQNRYGCPAGDGRAADGRTSTAPARSVPVSVLDLDRPQTRPDPLSDRGLRHDVHVVVSAVGENRPSKHTWQARLLPGSGMQHLRDRVQVLGLAADRWDRAVSQRFGRSPRR